MESNTSNWFIEETMFNKPTGNVRGIVTAFAPAPEAGGSRGRVRVAHAFLEVDKAPTVTLDAPKRAGLEDLEEIGKAILAFRARVAELDAVREEDVVYA